MCEYCEPIGENMMRLDELDDSNVPCGRMYDIVGETGWDGAFQIDLTNNVIVSDTGGYGGVLSMPIDFCPHCGRQLD